MKFLMSVLMVFGVMGMSQFAHASQCISSTYDQCVGGISAQGSAGWDCGSSGTSYMCFNSSTGEYYNYYFTGGSSCTYCAAYY